MRFYDATACNNYCLIKFITKDYYDFFINFTYPFNSNIFSSLKFYYIIFKIITYLYSIKKILIYFKGDNFY